MVNKLLQIACFNNPREEKITNSDKIQFYSCSRYWYVLPTLRLLQTLISCSKTGAVCSLKKKKNFFKSICLELDICI